MREDTYQTCDRLPSGEWVLCTWIVGADDPWLVEEIDRGGDA